jgi:hypothetical protein
MQKALHLHGTASTTERTSIDAPIYASCHVECSDSIHQGQFHSLACNSYPIIFNNTCSSWYEIAVNFIAAGARAYVGTIWKVDNSVARDAAKVFYEHLFEKGNLLDSFYEMTRSIRRIDCRSIYLYWGLHFSTLKIPKRKPDDEIFRVLVGSLIESNHEYDVATDPVVRRQYREILRFLMQEINTNFTPLHAERLKKTLEARLVDSIERPQEDDQPDDDITTRGVIDL